MQHPPLPDLTPANAAFLATVKSVVDEVAAGYMDEGSARLALWETLKTIGYTPERGFPGTPEGTVPPALAGSFEDLSSETRLNYIIGHQRSLILGRRFQLRGMEPARMAWSPAWELVRVEARDEPRNWCDGDGGTPPIHQGQADKRSRWTIAGGKLYQGRMIALKGDPVWRALGSSQNFDDATDTDYPPFAFNSGMGWREIDKFDAADLGLTSPEPPAAVVQGTIAAADEAKRLRRIKELRARMAARAGDDAAEAIKCYLEKEAAENKAYLAGGQENIQ